ncbi:MAG: hypothetical protein ACYDCL_21425 [Myxococcales bacterium]
MEIVSARMAVEPRPRSAVELADPELYERHRADALRWIADPALNFDVRERLVADYGIAR